MILMMSPRIPRSIVNVVNNVISQTGVDRILVCHGNTCMSLSETGYTPRGGLVSVADWQRAVDDGRVFIVQWGERAEALGWTAQDLFGLHDPPERPEGQERDWRQKQSSAVGRVV